MIILRSSQHLRELTVALSRCLPHSAKTYGRLYYGLKGIPGPLHVYVDSWPNFKAVIVQPTELAGEKMSVNRYSTFSHNPSSLADLLWDVVDWKKPFMLPGIDADLKDVVDDIAARRNVALSWLSPCYVSEVFDPAKVRFPQIKSDLEMSVLNANHVELVWNSWAYKYEPDTLNSIKASIAEGMPNSCVLDASGNPVAWLLVSLHGEIGCAYVEPEYRRKGLLYKCVAAVFAKLKEDAPAYCYIHKENTAALQLFKKIGLSMSNTHHYAWVMTERKYVGS